MVGMGPDVATGLVSCLTWLLCPVAGVGGGSGNVLLDVFAATFGSYTGVVFVTML